MPVDSIARGLATQALAAAQSGTLRAANNLNDVPSLNAAIRNLQGGYVLAQSAVGVSHTGDTAEFTLASVTLPAGAMGGNGRLVVEAMFTTTANANAKTPRIKLGTTQFGGLAITSSAASSRFGGTIQNRNSQSSQVFFTPAAIGPYNAGTGTAVQTSAVDTSQAQTIAITGQLGVGTDTITLEAYSVTLYPQA